MTTNLTNLTSINSFYDLGNYANTATDGLFWGLILMALFFILLINLRLNGNDNAIIASGFACLVISLLMLNLGWLNLAFPIIFALIIAGTVFYKVFTKN